MSADYYANDYLQQKLGPEAAGPGFGSTVWEWLIAIWAFLTEWFTFFWQTAVVIVIAFLIMIALCLCYSCCLMISHCTCPQLITFECVCPWLSLRALKRRFALISQPGLLKKAGAREGFPVRVEAQYPPTDVEQKLIERINELMKAEVPEVGDGF